MKIIKYVIIILALAAVFFTVYIATGKSDYEFTVTNKSKLSSQRMFKYVDNLQNFSSWNPWNTTESAFTTDSIYKGNNAKVTWNGNTATIAKSVANDSIQLNLLISGNDYKTTLFFNENNGETTINWKVKGNLTFAEKFKIFFQGTPETIIAPTFKQGLLSIDKNINESLKNFSIKNEGLTLIQETYYIKQVVETNIEGLGDKIFQSMEHMNNFAKNFELEPYGSPFTIFENINILSGNVKYAVCLPIKNFFSTAEGSDIMCEKLPAFHGYKTVLTGDYIHSDKAWTQVKKEVASKNLTQRADIKPIAIYKNSVLSTQKANEWITEFIIPVNETYIPIVETTTDTIQNAQ